MSEFNARVLQDQVISSATIYNDLVPLRAQIDALLAAGARATQAQLKSLAVPSSPDIVLYGNLVGRLNYWFNNQALFVPVGYKKQGNDFVPDVAPVDPLAAFKARQAVSQNCAWFQVTGGEKEALYKIYPPDVINSYSQFYAGGGSGGMNIQERPRVDGDPPSASGYVYVGQTGNWETDVEDAADIWLVAVATAQGRLWNGSPVSLTNPTPLVV